ncbi:MAG: tryptophan-rich sensory protein [Thermostichales cyanobacterium BF4_bins_65]
MLLIALAVNLGIPCDYEWFRRLRRPRWLTFEAIIPWIWLGIFTSGAFSALWVWQRGLGWGWMLAYGILEVLILAYMPVLCGLKNLRAAAIVGLSGWVWGMGMAILLWPHLPGAAALLAPYLLWSPVGIYVTWELIWLNPHLP